MRNLKSTENQSTTNTGKEEASTRGAQNENIHLPTAPGDTDDNQVN